MRPFKILRVKKNSTAFSREPFLENLAFRVHPEYTKSSKDSQNLLAKFLFKEAIFYLKPGKHPRFS